MTSDRLGRRWRRMLLVACCAVLAVACTAPPRSTEPVPDLPPSYSEIPDALAPETSEPVLRVAPDGDDDATGTADAPLATIARAAALATPGTTVIVADGTYTGAFTTRASGREDARITFVSETKWGAKLVGDGDDVPDEVDAVWRNYGDYVDVQGFDISGTTTDGFIQTGSFGRILENRVHGFTGGTCISTYKLDYALHDIDIIGNVVHGCGSTALHHGIYPGHPGGTISNNISYGNAGFGVHCWHNCNELVITNNLIFGNGEGGILIGQGDGPNYGDVDADGMLVANNIVVDNGKYGIEESGATGPGNRYLNNNVTGNDDGAFDLVTGNESGTIVADPGFVDYRPDGSGDYRLGPFSPNIDAGTAAGAPDLDLEGTERPQGAAVDIGVYER